MNRTLRCFKYIFLQSQVLFGIAVGLGIFLMILFEGFLNMDNGFQLNQVINVISLNTPLLGVVFISLVIGSYYQILCPFYLSFSNTRKHIYLCMKLVAWLPILELILLSLILLIFTNSSDRTMVIDSYLGLLGVSFIGLSFGELMGVLSLKFAKFGRIFPALLGGIGGGIGGFCSSFFADVERARSLTMAAALDRYAHVFLMIGIPLYLIMNIAVYRIIKNLSAH